LARLLAPLLESFFDQKSAGRSAGSTADLGMLRQIQASLDPKTVPEWSALQIAAFTKSGTGTAGDIYDIMRLPNGLAAMLVGSVTADVVRTATALPQIQGAFRLAGLHADPPKTQLKALNWILHHETAPCRMDAAILLINPKTGAAELSTAGAIGAVHVSVQGEAKRLALPASPAIGSTKSFEYAAVPLRMKIGDTLALYTPGWTKAKSETGTTLSEEKLVESICDGFNHPAAAAMEELLADLSPYVKKGTLFDDITLLLLYRAE
jgi:sigma-B regulation protein RsbU (phosphoserine phosphatase)